MTAQALPRVYDGEAELSSRQAAVLNSLVELFLANGYRQFGLDELATHARCSKTTLYSLAGSKEQLMARCVEFYFRRAASRIEDRIATKRRSKDQLQTYLLSVADELGTASDAFLRDVASDPTTRRSYESHTRAAADRVRRLVAEGVANGEFDHVHAVFVGEVAAAVMDAIERGGISKRTGLSHAQAYAELTLVLLGAVGSR